MLLSDYKGKKMITISDTILRRIRAKQRGWVFTPKDFLDVGSRAAVDQTLSRLVKSGVIRRLDRGLFDYPKQHPVLGTLSPAADKVAQAISAKTGDRAMPSGATAANMLGLSTQVSAKPVFVTNGKSRSKSLAGRIITLKHAKVPIIDNIPDIVNLALQALSYLGKDGVDHQAIVQCASRLADADVKYLTKASHQVPGWIADIILQIKMAKYGQIRTTT